MSWSVSAIGKPAAVAAKVEADLSSYKCADPEEGVKQAACAAILAGLKAQAANSVVRVAASGHQQPVYGKDAQQTGEFQNTLNVTVEPIYGFVE